MDENSSGSHKFGDLCVLIRSLNLLTASMVRGRMLSSYNKSCYKVN